MSSTLLALAGALTFVCADAAHHDGDNVRCSNVDKAIRLQGIDAPEMPGACRPGRACTPGDPFAARDYLRSLTAGRDVRCEAEGRDDYGRIIARCEADGIDLSCAMIASGHAVPRYAPIACSDQGKSVAGAIAPASPQAEAAAEQAVQPQSAQSPADAPAAAPVFAPPPPPTDWGSLLKRTLLGLLWLLLANGAVWLYLCRFWPAEEETWLRPEALDKRVYVGLAAIGGSPAALAGIWLRNPGDQQEQLEQPLTLVVGLHIGVLLGGLWWLIAG